MDDSRASVFLTSHARLSECSPFFVRTGYWLASWILDKRAVPPAAQLSGLVGAEVHPGYLLLRTSSVSRRYLGTNENDKPQLLLLALSPVDC